MLAPEFQIVRSDGTAYGAEAYLQSEFPRFPEPPQIGTLVVTGYGDHLVARYEITSKIMLGDETELRHAPRLTVFRKGSDGTWLVVAHSNFAALSDRNRTDRPPRPAHAAPAVSVYSPCTSSIQLSTCAPVGHAERDAVGA